MRLVDCEYKIQFLTQAETQGNGARSNQKWTHKMKKFTSEATGLFVWWHQKSWDSPCYEALGVFDGRDVFLIATTLDEIEEQFHAEVLVTVRARRMDFG
jgi:hypothetical protein